MNQLDTIAAVSTPYGKGGIAVLRVSGDDAIAISNKVFSPIRKGALSDMPSAKAVYGNIFESVRGNKNQIDDGIAVVFRAPASFTGEDTVEISCHGGVLITQKVLSALLSAGARMALPGEFTKRAFINGKMSLTGAEALGDLLEAKSDEQIYLARSGMRGALSDSIQKIYNPLCDVLASIFAKIDYPDEDLADIGSKEMLEIATKCLNELRSLSATYSTGKAVNEGVPTAIIGRTNAGKSSLYNRLVGRDAAIVTDIEGTTRDILTETTYLGRVCLLLSDTAGLRDSTDTVEQIGVERARRQAEGADLILAVFDGSREPDEDDIAFISYVESINSVKVAVINKQDLGQNEEFLRLTKNFDATVAISADNGMGFDSLCDAIEKLYIDRSLDTARDAIVSNARQHAAIINAIDALDGAVSAIENELPLEICCSETERCLQALGEIDGRTVSEDIVSRIFANFCVGK